MAFTPKFIPNDNLDEEPLEDIRVAVVIPEIEEILDERKFMLLKYTYTIFYRAFLCFLLPMYRVKPEYRKLIGLHFVEINSEWY